MVNYTTRLGERLKQEGYARDLLLLHTGGGVMTPASVKDFAARLAGSGIAAGAIASRYIAMLCGFRELDRPRHGRHLDRRVPDL